MHERNPERLTPEQLAAEVERIDAAILDRKAVDAKIAGAGGGTPASLNKANL